MFHRYSPKQLVCRTFNATTSHPKGMIRKKERWIRLSYLSRHSYRLYRSLPLHLKPDFYNVTFLSLRFPSLVMKRVMLTSLSAYIGRTGRALKVRFQWNKSQPDKWNPTLRLIFWASICTPPTPKEFYAQTYCTVWCFERNHYPSLFVEVDTGWLRHAVEESHDSFLAQWTRILVVA